MKRCQVVNKEGGELLLEDEVRVYVFIVVHAGGEFSLKVANDLFDCSVAVDTPYSSLGGSAFRGKGLRFSSVKYGVRCSHHCYVSYFSFREVCCNRCRHTKAAPAYFYSSSFRWGVKCLLFVEKYDVAISVVLMRIFDGIDHRQDFVFCPGSRKSSALRLME